MRKFMIMAVWLLSCCCSLAIAVESEKQINGETETTESETEERAKQEEVQQGKQLQWPRPYQPREEISADSMVPFPTDI